MRSAPPPRRHSSRRSRGCARCWRCPSPASTSGGAGRVSAAQRRRELLADQIGALFEAFDDTYGYRRIHAELVRAGERVCPKLVRRLMRGWAIVPVQPRPFRTTTEPDPDAAGSVDLVKRDFAAQRPGTKVVGDITYIRTWQGWLYLASLD